MKPLPRVTLVLTAIIILFVVVLPAMADNNQLTPTIEDRCKGWTRDSESWRQLEASAIEDRQKANQQKGVFHVGTGVSAPKHYILPIPSQQHSMASRYAKAKAVLEGMK